MNNSSRLPSPDRIVPGRLLFLLWVWIVASAGTAFAAEVEVLIPRQGATIVARNPETHLVLRQAFRLGAGLPSVEVNGSRIEPVVISEGDGEKYLHFRIPLKPDLNSFTVLPSKQRIEFRYRPLRADLNLNSLGKDVDFFHKDGQLPERCALCHDLQRSTPMTAAGLAGQSSCATCHRNVVDKAAKKHSTTVNRQCLTCHQQYVKPWRIGFPTGKVENLCLECHTGKREWSSRKNIHGPMVFGGCTVCHNPHGDDNRYQLWAEGSLQLCVTCHSDKENLLADHEKPVPFAHRIIHGPGCVACHDPHATDYQFVLHKPVNELCIGCHSRFAGIKRGHPVGGHPVTGPKERRRPGRELNCTSCHDPHGSTHKYLLIGESRGGHVCVLCHR